MLPNLDEVFAQEPQVVQSHFVFYKPKDIVSGDFYWATHINEWLLLSVVDCTGHGVPGAFMSMLGISHLNEISLSEVFVSPATILERLRTHVVSALNQKEKTGSRRDGMEMSVLSLNTKTLECYWAGAKSPLWIIRGSNGASGKFPEIEEIKADPIPVSLHVYMEQFTNHEIKVNKGDKLYIFSDGYADQFGGPEGKKFNMYKAFNKLIAETSSLPMKKQGAAIEDTYYKWVNYNGKRYGQVDDITVIGIEL